MPPQEHTTCGIDWNLYLEYLKEKPGFKEVQQFYVSIGIQLQKSHLQDHEPGSLDLPAIVQDHIKLVLLGEPGSGKTWAVKHLALGQAEARLRDAEANGRIPIYAELRDWNVLSEKAGKTTAKELRRYILDFLWKSLQRSQISISEVDDNDLSVLQNELKSHAFTLIFDGLDEIRDPAKRKLFATSLTRFSRHFAKSDHVYIVASRKYGFDEELSAILHGEGFAIAEMSKRPADDVKLALLNHYLPTQVNSHQLLQKLKVNYRLSRLTDNALLLNILAEHYKSGEEPPQTRGRFLQTRTDAYITRSTELPKETAKEFLSRLASEMRTQRRRDLEELNVIPMLQSFLSEFLPQAPIHATKFLTLLLETNLLKRRPGPVDEISFELPQYEDYFLARKAYIELKRALRTDPKEALKLPYILNTEWHHVLILASGLLEQEEVENLADALDDQQYLLLKARILGEAIAPQAEDQFIERLRRRLRRAFNRALTGLSRWTMSVLVLWWIGILPLAFLLDAFWPLNPWAAFTVLLLYFIGLPFLFRFTHPRLFQYHVNKITNRTLPEMLSALVCLRTGVVEKELSALRQKLEQMIPWGATREDYLVLFITSVTSEIDQAINLTNQDPDTILSQIEENPRIIHHWLNTASEAFSPNDVEILVRVMKMPHSRWLKIQEKCINKLREVAVVNPPLKGDIIDALRALVSDPLTNAELIKLAQQAINVLIRPVSVPRPLTPHVKVTVFAFLCGASLVGIYIFTGKYGHGANFWQKLINFWPLYPLWFSVMLVLANFLLPVKLLDLFQKLKPSRQKLDQSGPRQAQR